MSITAEHVKSQSITQGKKLVKDAKGRESSNVFNTVGGGKGLETLAAH